ncbi:serine hydrolase domain-containing protein [Gorillibacterium timonense]|uniref:serine hydrolase domain-containing protein n=1 Tax=Gorillibacterium timonense TaxID=1689269 RepID=UPI00071D7A32|nr:serine hydrolase [Gorillibacterium timonense]
MESFIQHVHELGLQVNGVIVTQNGRRLLEHAFVPDKRQRIYSCTKTFLGTACGVALDQGLFSLHDQAVNYFADEWALTSADRRQWEQVTIERLLTMSIADFPFSCKSEKNWLNAILDLPLPEISRKQLNYSNVPTYLLSIILERASGRKTWEFMAEHVFTPLDIEPVADGANCPEGYFIGGYGIAATLRELDRLGHLYGNDGVYQGRRIVSEEWTREAMKPHGMKPEGNGGYGYLMWSVPGVGAMIAGMLGQICLICRDKNAVITILSDLPDRSGQEDILYKLLWDDLYANLS